jgi:hypothetical protein
MVPPKVFQRVNIFALLIAVGAVSPALAKNSLGHKLICESHGGKSNQLRDKVSPKRYVVIRASTWILRNKRRAAGGDGHIG